MVRHGTSLSSRRERTIPKPLTNRDVILWLQTLPENRPFGASEDRESSEFLRQLYIPLRSLFGTSTKTSQANRARIEKINKLTVPHRLLNRFTSFQQDPLEFWERLVLELPKYSGQEQKARSRTFLQGVAQLDSNIEEQRVL